jgi:hypothetical protein
MAQEQEGMEAMGITIVVACKGASKRCENEGFSDKPTRSCSSSTMDMSQRNPLFLRGGHFLTTHATPGINPLSRFMPKNLKYLERVR